MARIALAAASIALLSLCALAPTAQAATSATIVIQTAPPPVHYEAAPRARRGMVWVPGHWEWRHDRYRWIDGYWLKARPGYRYNAPQWRERGGRRQESPAAPRDSRKGARTSMTAPMTTCASDPASTWRAPAITRPLTRCELRPGSAQSS